MPLCPTIMATQSQLIGRVVMDDLEYDNSVWDYPSGLDDSIEAFEAWEAYRRTLDEGID